MGLKVGGPVAVRVVVAQLRLECESGEPEEALLRGGLPVPEDILPQLVVVVLPRDPVPDEQVAVHVELDPKVEDEEGVPSIAQALHPLKQKQQKTIEKLEKIRPKKNAHNVRPLSSP